MFTLTNAAGVHPRRSIDGCSRGREKAMAIVNGRLAVWVNVFIPRDVPGYTEAITKGENAGKTAVRLPKAARVALVNLHKPLGTGYLTDQRSFNSSINASSRMQSIAWFDLSPARLHQVDHSTSGTIEANIDSGSTQMMGIADMSNCSSSKLLEVGALPVIGWGDAIDTLDRMTKEQPHRPGEGRGSYDPDAFVGYMDLNTYADAHRAPRQWLRTPPPSLSDRYAMMVRIVGEASDPLVYWAANIDYDFLFVVGVDGPNNRVLVGAFGLIDAFPAYEAYAKFNGVTKTLMTVPPPPGNTVTNLLGEADRLVTAVVSFP
jgi:hypothetical protein